MSRQSRRTFLKRAATVGVATNFTISGTKASGSVLGANDTIHVGVAGLNGRGGSHVSAYLGIGNVQVTRLIDSDTRILDGRGDSVKKLALNIAVYAMTH